MPSIKDLLEAMTASWPVALAVFLAGASILGGYHFDIHYLTALPDWLPGVTFIATLCSASILTVTITRSILELVTRPFRRKAWEEWQAKHIAGLDELPEAEALLLAWAVANKTRVFSAPYFNPHTKALVAKGLLTIPGGSHHTDEMPFEVPDHIWGALKENLTKTDLRPLQGLHPF
ncbi:hypothetical protein [Sinorhizobium meliloti]|uniref:hypothetical protein n=1 Tax=Rhizobium meliloti TaxID=382 RepID=UPI00299F3058|nr:hypothetical protein [Sinorhizobium meliloti]